MGDANGSAVNVALRASVMRYESKTLMNLDDQRWNTLEDVLIVDTQQLYCLGGPIFSKENPNDEKISRASTQQKEHMISTSATQHQTKANCDQNSLFGQNRDNSYDNRLPKNYHQRLQQNNSGSSSVSGKKCFISP